jgi:hypothetical protein
VRALFRWLRSWWSRLTAGLALGAVALATGVISYHHIYALSIALFQSPINARLFPIGIDGLIVVGSVVLLQASPNHPYLGWFGVVPGVAASVFANVESGIAHGWLAAMWAGVPSAGFALATFLLERWLKDQFGGVVEGGTGAVGNGGGADPVATSANQCSHGGAETVEQAVQMHFLHGRDCYGQPPSLRHLSTTWQIPRPRVKQLVGALNGSKPADMDGDDQE